MTPTPDHRRAAFSTELLLKAQGMTGSSYQQSPKYKPRVPLCNNGFEGLTCHGSSCQLETPDRSRMYNCCAQAPKNSLQV